jgi:hypothetical protein
MIPALFDGFTAAGAIEDIGPLPVLSRLWLSGQHVILRDRLGPVLALQALLFLNHAVIALATVAF